MRSYPTNSPQACSRVLAAIMLSDAQLSAVELDVLERQSGCHRLGIDRQVMLTVLQQLCEDLRFDEHLTWAEACQLPEATLQRLLDEVSSPALREQLLGMALAITLADRHLADGECSVMARVLRHWQMDPQRLNPMSLMA